MEAGHVRLPFIWVAPEETSHVDQPKKPNRGNSVCDVRGCKIPHPHKPSDVKVTPHAKKYNTLQLTSLPNGGSAAHAQHILKLGQGGPHTKGEGLGLGICLASLWPHLKDLLDPNTKWLPGALCALEPFIDMEVVGVDHAKIQAVDPNSLVDEERPGKRPFYNDSSTRWWYGNSKRGRTKEPPEALLWVTLTIRLRPSFFFRLNHPDDCASGPAVSRLLPHLRLAVQAGIAGRDGTSGFLAVGTGAGGSGSGAVLGGGAAGGGGPSSVAAGGDVDMADDGSGLEEEEEEDDGGLGADDVESAPGGGAGSSAGAPRPTGDEPGTEGWVPSDRATGRGHSVHDEVFEVARPRDWTVGLPDPPGLKCHLYRYQRRALAWMAWREGAAGRPMHPDTHNHALPAAAPTANGGPSCGLPRAATAAAAAGMGTGNGKAERNGAALGGKKAGAAAAAAVAGKAAAVEAEGDGDIGTQMRRFSSALSELKAPAGWPEDSRVHLLWQPMKLQSGHTVWLNREEGLLSQELPKVKFRPLLGGMLCDEMGLGKTVEVIALMLAHPPPHPHTLPHILPHTLPHTLPAASDDDVIMVSSSGNVTDDESSPGSAGRLPDEALRPGPTLIVTPLAIMQQWVGEIRTHSNLKVEVYNGLRAHLAESRAVRERAARIAETELKRLEKVVCALEKQQLRLLGQGGTMPGGRKAQKKKQGASAASSSRGDGGASASGADKALEEEKERLRLALEEAEEAVRVAAAAAEAAQRATNMSEQVSCEEEVERLATCDVVITNYSVLSQEVWMREDRPIKQLRHEKRYSATPSPLRKLSWHRLVLDEAQMVGAGLTNVAEMAGCLTTKYRWCVTGTPIGAGGLGDIMGAICALRYSPLDDPSNFMTLVVKPYLLGSQHGFKCLQWALKPIMWRNSKAIASEDLQLPPRSLRNALLALQPVERTFYQHVLDDTRKANAEWLAHQAAVDLFRGDMDESAEETRQRLGHGNALSRRAMTQLTQLRLACVHPQLTESWKTLSNELQLGQAQGGAMSVTEMLSKMRDQAQLHLQNEEREFCQAADALATKLLKQAQRLHPEDTALGHDGDGHDDHSPQAKQKGAKKRKRAADGHAAGPSDPRPSNAGAAANPRLANGGPSHGGQDDDDGGDGGAGGDGGVGEGGAAEGAADAWQSPAARAARLRQEALQLLETSYRVGEKGIDAAPPAGAGVGVGLDGGEEGGEGGGVLEDITAGAASWRAWRLVQVRTCQLLAERYTSMGRADEAARLRGQLVEKEAELQETVDMNIAKGESHLASLQERAGLLQHQQLPEAWQQAQQEGFPLEFLEARMQDTGAWAEDVHTRWEGAREKEAAKRVNIETDANPDAQVMVLLGTEVTSLLSGEEAGLTSVRHQVEGRYGAMALGAVGERVKAALQVVESRHAPAPDHHHTTASALWCASKAVEKALTQRTVMMHTNSGESVAAAKTVMQGWIVPGGDTLGQASTRRWLNNMLTRLKERQSQYQGQDSEGRGRQLLGRCGAEALFRAMDALRMMVDLLRLWREIHVASLKLEVEASNRDLIHAEVATAAAGETLRSLPSKYQRMGMSDLKDKCDELRKSCEDLRSRKAYLENQMQAAAGGGAHPQDAHPPLPAGPGPAAGPAAPAGSMLPDQPLVPPPATLVPTTVRVLPGQPPGAPAAAPAIALAALATPAFTAGMAAASRAHTAVSDSGNLPELSGASAGSGGPHGPGGTSGTGSLQGPGDQHAALHAGSSGRTHAQPAASESGLTGIDGRAYTQPLHATDPAQAPLHSTDAAQAQPRVAACTCSGPYQRRTGISAQLRDWFQQCTCAHGRAGASVAAGGPSGHRVAAAVASGQATQHGQGSAAQRQGGGSQGQAGAPQPGGAAPATQTAPTTAAAGPGPLPVAPPTGSTGPMALPGQAEQGPSAVSPEATPAGRKQSRKAVAPRLPGPGTEFIDLTLEDDEGGVRSTADLVGRGGGDGVRPTADLILARGGGAGARPVAALAVPRVAEPSGMAGGEAGPSGVAGGEAGPSRARDVVTLDMDVDPPLAAAHQGPLAAADQGPHAAADQGQRGATSVECNICLNTLEEGAPLMVYTCGHYFCSACSEEILSVARARCPTCRRDVVRNQVFRVVASRMSANTQRHNPELDPPEGKRVLNVKLVGTWMTKLEALLRRLLLLRSTAPDEKALVFSQFPLALDLVSKALTVNHVGHVSLTRGQKGGGGARDSVARFNTDNSVHVFLLSLHHGAAGLTLVRANHVFMLDVSTDPAVEQQAVARVHRIGQSRPVTVTRLLCDGTVEMQVLEALEHKQQLLHDQSAPLVMVEGEEEEGDVVMVVEGEEEAAPGGGGQEGGGRLHSPASGAAAAAGNGAGPSRASQRQVESSLLAGGAPKKEALGMDEAARLLSQL